MVRQVFRTSGAPVPVAQYSQAARVGGLVAAAGQVGIDAATGDVVGPGVAEQTTQAMANADAALRAAGLTLDDVVRMDCYVTDEADLPAFNAAYAAWFPTDPPARTTVVVGLMQGLRVEVTALAVVS
jgi:2-iminobutanoate/2-iminopropanoate deaminase